jgi:hypothetical protein
MQPRRNPACPQNWSRIVPFPFLGAIRAQIRHWVPSARRLLPRLDRRPGGQAGAGQHHALEVLEYPELGMEAVWKIDVVDFPAFVVVDDKGNDLFDEFRATAAATAATPVTLT